MNPAGHSKPKDGSSSKPYSSASSGSAQYTSADYSYFSPHAPLTSPSSAPNLSYNAYSTNTALASSLYAAPQTQTTHTTMPGGSVITSIASTRGNGGGSYLSTGGYGMRGPHPAHVSPPEMLQQFALQIPAPPPLTLSIRNPNSAPSSGTVTPAQRAPPPSAAPQMALSSTEVRHTLSVLLPRNITPEMVTISANKGDRIRVVADAFGGDECAPI